MSNANQITISGNMGKPGVLRFTPQGKAVANGRVADTPRRLNRDTNQWEDAGETLWLGFSIWDRKAEALAEAAHKGDLVTVVGQLTARSYQTNDGQTREVVEVKATDVAVVPKVTAQPQSSGNWSQPAQPQQPAQADPWNQGTGGGGWGGQPANDEPPF